MTNVCSTFCSRLSTGVIDFLIIMAYSCVLSSICLLVVGIAQGGNSLTTDDCAKMPDELVKSKCFDEVKAQHHEDSVTLIVEIGRAHV